MHLHLHHHLANTIDDSSKNQQHVNTHNCVLKNVCISIHAQSICSQDEFYLPKANTVTNITVKVVPDFSGEI